MYYQSLAVPKRIHLHRWLDHSIKSLLVPMILLFLVPTFYSQAYTVFVVQAGKTVAAAYTVSGTVFDDYNQDGIDSATEPGINGIVVTAYNAAGTVVTSATTSTIASVLGQYTLSIAAGIGPVRLQFSNYGTGSSIADLTGLSPSNHAGGTNVQFVSGASATNTVNLGLERPADYCQNLPTLTTSCYIFGDQTLAGHPVLVSFPSSAIGTTATPTPVAPKTLADSPNIGSTWGLAYRRSSDSLFASAYLKDHSGFKPSGSTGAIYLISAANTATPGAPTLFVDLNVAVSAGIAGANPHNAANYSADLSAFDQVGKVSLGGMAISDDNTTLYVMNLANKTLYAIAVGTPPAGPTLGAISSTVVPVPADCASSDFRPFAVTSYHGLIYVGAVCSAESTVTGPLPLGNPAKMHAYVFAYTPGSGFTVAPKFEISLNYTRHCVYNIANCTAAGASNLTVGHPAAWNPWHTGYYAYQPSGNNYISYPEPMLTSLAFNHGDLLLGLRDRFADQTSPGTPDDPARPGTNLGSMQAGDLLRACLNTPGNFTSGWTLESNASCGGIQTAGSNNGRGPGTGVYNALAGNGQYYYQADYSQSGIVAHDYVPDGGVLQIPEEAGVRNVIMDPFSAATGGEVLYDNTAGTKGQAYQIYSAALVGGFGKSDGLGSLAAFCQAAPIEIGHRIWRDANGNGKQDAGEAGIAGVMVHLYAANGTTLLQTTTTDATGAYYFLISPYTSYVIKVDRATDYTSGGPLSTYRLTYANQDVTNHLIDSKATLPIPASAIGPANYPQISVASHTPGQNDSVQDIGMVPPPNLSLIKTVASSPSSLVSGKSRFAVHFQGMGDGPNISRPPAPLTISAPMLEA